jgi:penicillin amidase
VNGEMKKRNTYQPSFLYVLFSVSLFFVFLDIPCASGPSKERIILKGLSHPVEIIQDRWGISHIYASTEKDLFFAQGFNVARDRLFQLEIWRRQATGTLAEILGARALRHDIGARLLKARVNMKKELSHYHPRGEEIIGSFVQGINAYIDLAAVDPRLLPVEFHLLGIKPGNWTPEVVVSRHNGLFRNVRDEVALARLAEIMGFDQLRNLLDLHPGEPILKAEKGLDLASIPANVLELYLSSRRPPEFEPDDIVNPANRKSQRLQSFFSNLGFPYCLFPDLGQMGSNNWVLSGKRTLSGQPLLANDPHRQQQIPSLRYWVHLVGPGWNVIGGGEPALPGVSIGHNEQGAWGLTIFAIDQEDLMVYDLNPAKPNQYWYNGRWERMNLIHEMIPVKGEVPFQADLKFTRHGPVLYEDEAKHKAYALRAAWLEVGAAPYLASLRMDQARTWEEFREACRYSLTPSENMVWADRIGNIGWQVVGAAPLRRGWNGLLPVSGDGRYEWKGFLPVLELPHSFNPPEGYIATANQDNIPPGYAYPLGFLWAEPYRYSRLVEVLGSGKKMTLADMTDLQQDVLSIPARQLVPLLDGLSSPNAKVKKAVEILLHWNFRLAPDSAAAAIYVSWQRRLSEIVWSLYLPEKARPLFPYRSLRKMIDFLMAPESQLGPDPWRSRNEILLAALAEAIEDLTKRFGPDMSQWRYGDGKFHHIRLFHPLSQAMAAEWKGKYDLGALPRGGDGNTVNSTSNSDNQTSGASFRIVEDLGNWDNSLGTNNPGQSGDPLSPHYADLFSLWAGGKYFPVFFSRTRVESAAERIFLLEPPD